MHSENESADAVLNNKEPSGDTASINSSSIGVLLDPKPTKRWRNCRFGGMTLVALSAAIASIAITIALILSIIMGSPQVPPHGVVVSESEYCNDYALKAMKEYDGTAVDAAVVAALCLSVVRPDLASLAGCGMMLVKDRDTQTSWLYDFQCSAPSNPAAVDPTKPDTLVAVPGFLKGLQMAHAKFGKRTWESQFSGALQAALSGFEPSPALVNQAQSVKAELKDNAGPIVDALSSKPLRYQPSVQLLETLKTLSTDSGSYFYTTQQYPMTFGTRLMKFVNSFGNTNWNGNDLLSYKVLQPRPLVTEFAGYHVEAFPAPSSGGPYLLSLLGNLNLKNKLSPIDSDSLKSNEDNATAMMMHRLIEFAKLAETEASKLGDPTDKDINSAVLEQQNKMFLDKTRRTVVDEVDDKSDLQWKTSVDRAADVRIGDTSIITSDSKHLTVVLSSFMGSPFGTGQVVPETGVHLNAALKLFSPPSTDQFNPILNTLASGRRPLVPISPVYVSTIHHKCGVRFGLGTSGGWWGMMDAAQVISNGALFLHGSTCISPEPSDPHADTISPIESSHKSSKESAYNPATEIGCLNGKSAIDASRVHSGNIQSVAEQIGNGSTVFYETGLHSPIVQSLKGMGYALAEKATEAWPGGASLGGWNVYDVLSAVDKRNSWSRKQF